MKIKKNNPLLRSQWLKLLLSAVLLLVTLAVFWQVKDHHFVEVDDPDYVTENPMVRQGLSLEGVLWAMTATHAANWHPVTWLSHMLDCQLFGLDPTGPHLVNLLLHLANMLLLFLFLSRLTDALWRSALVAALFALHPMHVESVAWVAERKDVLSTLFWLLTMWAYVRYAERPGVRRYFLVLALFALGLMAKPMVVTLPLVLLLLDYWPLGRFSQPLPAAGKAKAGSQTPPPRLSGRVWSLVQEKIPLFFLSLLSSLLTLWAQKGGGAVVDLRDLPLTTRLGHALVSYISYLGKILWPTHLAVFYPYPAAGLLWWQVAGAALILSLITVLVFRWRKHYPYLVMGWLWYLVTLIPVIGVVQVGLQAMADRYTYVPSIGIFLMFSWGMVDLTAAWRYRRVLVSTLAGAALLALGFCTAAQVRHWSDSWTLSNHALQVTEDNYMAYNILGKAYDDRGNLTEAITMYRKAIEICPGYAPAYNNLGQAFARQGRLTQAMAMFQQALRLNPSSAVIHLNLGNAYDALGNLTDAITMYRKAIEIYPRCDGAYNNLGLAYARQGRLSQAIPMFQQALRLNPGSAGIHLNLALAYADKGDLATARALLEKVLQIDPHYGEAQRILRLMDAQSGIDE